MRRFKIVLAFVLLVAAWIGGVHVATQEGRFVFGPEMTGLILVKGGYRSWSVSWADGRYYDGKRWRYGHFAGDLSHEFIAGYRWPRFRHIDMRLLKQLDEK